MTAVLVLLLRTVWFAPKRAARPVFARKYRTSCTSCHVAIPKRNPFGEAFRRNGYRLPVEVELAVKEAPVILGAEGWKSLWPKAVYPGFLPASEPIGFYVHQRLVWKEEKPGEDTANLQLDMPHEVEVVFGGTLGENISFFGEWLVFELGHTDEGRLGAFSLQYNDLFGLCDLLESVPAAHHQRERQRRSSSTSIQPPFRERWRIWQRIQSMGIA